jgi:hypothetical protein
MPARLGEPQRDARTHRFGSRQRLGGKEGVVDGVDHERRQQDAAQAAPAGRALPVVPCIAESVHRRGDRFVEVVERAGGQHPLTVEEPGVLGELGQALALERAQEVPGIDLVETA